MNSFTFKTHCMINSRTILFLLTFLIAPSFSEAKLTDCLDGIWEGTGTQNNNTSWTIRFTANSGEYSIEYPSLACGGTWSVIDDTSYITTFYEKITFGNKCVDNGTVELYSTGSRSLKYIYFLPSGDIEAHGQLTCTNCVKDCRGSIVDGIAQCQADPTSCGILALTLSNIPSHPSEIDTSLLETHNNYISYFLLQISHSLPIDVSVDYFTMDVTATAGQDYIMTSGKATIPAGETSTTIGVEIIGDTVKEEDETFKLVINNPQGANFPEGISEITASRTISDDD